PSSGTCGNCTRCLEVCPTQAFDAAWLLDARKCISYLTIELRAPVEPELRPAMGDWIFGCDLCQTICPYNKSSVTTSEPRLIPNDPVEAAYPSLEELLSYREEAEFKKDYADRPQIRPRRRAMLQSAAYAAANLHATALIPLLESLARTDRDPLIRTSALHALEQLKTLSSKK
ncbi:MAG: 4Fe-4S double cluster binding domain-containing protein, partial [bacterium]